MEKPFIILIWAVLTALFIQVNPNKQTIQAEKVTGTVDSTSADTIFSLANQYARIGKFDSAIICLTKAAALFQSSKQYKKYANCLIKLSDNYVRLGAVGQAKKYAREALTTSLESSNMHEVGESYNVMGVFYCYTGQLDSAMVFFNRAISVWTQNNDTNQVNIAEAYANQASIYLAYNDFEKSLALIRKAMSITQSLKGDFDDNLAYYYNTIGGIYHKKGHFQEAINYYQKALDIWVPKYGNAHPLVGALYNNVGDIYLQEENFGQALIYLNKAVSIYESLVDVNDPRLAYIINNIANVKIKLKDYTGAFINLKRALNIYTCYKGMEDKTSLIQNSIAKIYEETGKTDSAEYYYNVAILTMAKIAPNSQLLAVLYSNLANLHAKNLRFDQAIPIFEQAINISSACFGEKHPRTALFYHNIGDTYLSKGDLFRALRYFQQSLIANIMEFNDTIPDHNPDSMTPLSKHIFVSALVPKASIFYLFYAKQPDSLYYLKVALSTIDIAIKTLDEMRTGLRSRETKVYADKQLLKAYEDGITYAYLLYKKTGLVEYLEQAYYYSESKRSAVLFSLVTELEARTIGGIPESLQNLEKSIYLDLIFYEKKIQEEKLNRNPDKEKIKLWQNLYFNLNQTYDSLINSFERQFPEYYKLKFDLKTSGISEVQDGLGANDALIEYTFGANMLFTFVITPYTATLIGTSVDESSIKSIELFREMLLHKDYSVQSVAEYREIAAKLYSILLKRVEPLLRNKSLIIIPDEKLATIPFEALIKEDKNNTYNSYRTMPYLVKDYSIGYGYSATILLNSLKIKNRSLKNDILAFAPSFNTDNQKLITELKTRDEKLIALEGAREEVKNIHELFGGRLFIDTSATKKNFLQFSPKFNILHISTHGIMDDVRPMESKLMFYQKNDSADNASLYAYELYSLQLPSSLVVLSACNTGYGKLVAGEGIISLARGFMYAGVPSVLSTLWNVNDHSTSVIMTSFYKYLKKREKKTEALQHAQIDYLSSADNITAHPFYWSGFILTGNNHPVLWFSPSVLYVTLPVAVILLTLFVIIFWVKRRKSKKALS